MQFSDIKPKIFAKSLRPLTQKTEKNQSFKVAMNVVKYRDEVKVSLCLKLNVYNRQYLIITSLLHVSSGSGCCR